MSTAITRSAVEAAAAKYGVVDFDVEIVARLAEKGRAWLESEAARLKSAPDHHRKGYVLAMARIAWEVAS